jgi:hypothetical protein
LLVAAGLAAVAVLSPAASAKVMTFKQAMHTMHSTNADTKRQLQHPSTSPFAGAVAIVTRSRYSCVSPRARSVQTTCKAHYTLRWRSVADGRDLNSGTCATTLRLRYASPSTQATKVRVRVESFICRPIPDATPPPAGAPAVPASPQLVLAGSPPPGSSPAPPSAPAMPPTPTGPPPGAPPPPTGPPPTGTAHRQNGALEGRTAATDQARAAQATSSPTCSAWGWNTQYQVWFYWCAWYYPTYGRYYYQVYFWAPYAVIPGTYFWYDTWG